MRTPTPPFIPFEHRYALGRPSCPHCGTLCAFPEAAELALGTVRNEWRCEVCHESFETTAELASSE
jgi:hypothetical protein